MGGAEILGTTGRMQRVGLKQQRASQRGLGGEEHGGLAAAVGVAAEEEAAADALAERAARGAQPFAIARGAGGRRPPAQMSLAVGQVAAQDGDAARGERLGHRYQQRRVGIAAGPVGEDEAVGAARPGRVQDAADGRVTGDVDALDVPPRRLDQRQPLTAPAASPLTTNRCPMK